MAVWEVTYISCEGNERWYEKEVPCDWEEWQVRETILIGGCGDDIAEILSVEKGASFYCENSDKDENGYCEECRHHG